MEEHQASRDFVAAALRVDRARTDWQPWLGDRCSMEPEPFALRAVAGLFQLLALAATVC